MELEKINPEIKAVPRGVFDFEKLDWSAAQEALASLKAFAPNTLIHGAPGSSKAFLLAWWYQ